MEHQTPHRWSWLLIALCGLACVAVGCVLVVAPLNSLRLLAIWVALGLIATGAAQLATQGWLGRSVGIGWIVIGAVTPLLPGLTLRMLALVVGIALVIGGAVKVFAGTGKQAADRIVSVLLGLATVIAGLLALIWPSATILVLALLFGVRTILFGIGLLGRALTMRRGGESGVSAWDRAPAWLRLTAAVATLGLAIGGAWASVAIHRANPGPDAFYTAPADLPEGPGKVIATEEVPGFEPLANTYRILYTSTGHDGHPVAVSGLVFVPLGEPATEPRKVVAFTHGTVGVAVPCAPSLQKSAAAAGSFEGLQLFLKSGRVVVASDYQGLGTAGPHMYLIGDVEGKNTLDIVRAARAFTPAHAGTDFVTWGHSQGGHASIFTGQLAASYAPELKLLGTAAGAPVPDIKKLFEVNIKTTTGKALIAMTLKSWSDLFADADLNDVLAPGAVPAVRKIARYCLYPPQLFATIPSALLLGFAFVPDPPWDSQPWRGIVADNTPGSALLRVPVMLIQGLVDPIVDPQVTVDFAEKLCGQGETVSLRTYPGVAHLDGGFAAAPDVAAWMADRFAGVQAPSTC